MHDTGMLLLSMTGYAAFFVTLVLSLIMIPLGLPGTFVIVLSYLLYLVFTGGSGLTWTLFAVMLVMAIAGEVVETGAGYFGARQAKGSVWSSVAAVAGGIAGALIGAFFGLLGAIPGAFAGTFAGAYLAEYWRTRESGTSAKVAGGALLGRLVGTVTKVTLGIVMCCLIVAVLVARALP